MLAAFSPGSELGCMKTKFCPEPSPKVTVFSKAISTKIWKCTYLEGGLGRGRQVGHGVSFALPLSNKDIIFSLDFCLAKEKLCYNECKELLVSLAEI